jgi:hypothetical protein
LVHEFLESVSIKEAAFLASMSMEVTVHDQMVLLVKMVSQLTNCIACWLGCRIGILVVSIEILIELVHTVMTLVHSIGVEHWDAIEHEVLPQ